MPQVPYDACGSKTMAARPGSQTRRGKGRQAAVYVFLSGAEMQPERVRATWPEARFMARGRLEPRPIGAVVAPIGAQYETWGIIVEIPPSAVEGEERGAISDDGRPFTVMVLSPEDRDAAAVLAAARYWELPPVYVRRLLRTAAASSDESSDG